MKQSERLFFNLFIAEFCSVASIGNLIKGLLPCLVINRILPFLLLFLRRKQHSKNRNYFGVSKYIKIDLCAGTSLQLAHCVPFLFVAGKFSRIVVSFTFKFSFAGTNSAIFFTNCWSSYIHHGSSPNELHL